MPTGERNQPTVDDVKERIAALMEKLSAEELRAMLLVAEIMSLHPALGRAFTAPPDDEPVTEEERRMIQEAEADTKPTIPLEQLLKEFGG